MTLAAKRIGSLAAVLIATTSFGCSGKAGPAGSVPPLVNDIRGTVTDGTAPLGGVTVTANPGGLTATSAANGSFALLAVPLGAYAVTFHKAGYVDREVQALVNLSGATQLSAALASSPTVTDPPTVSASDVLQAGFGADGSIQATGTGVAPLTYQWVQVAGPTLALSGTDTATVTFSTANFQASMGAAINFPRFGVLGINPDQAGGSELQVKVTDGTGRSVTATVRVDATRPSTGLRNVPVGVPVWLQGDGAPLTPAQSSWSWTLDGTGATGSQATLSDPAGQFPSFVPDVTGTYLVAEAVSGKSMKVYAGTWVGEGTTDAQVTCVACHTGSIAPDMFTPFQATAHAGAMERKLDGQAGPSFAEACLQCHSVGYEKAAANGGFDDLQAIAGWTFPSTLQIGNYLALQQVPGLGQLAGIQCENCHGPQGQPSGGPHTSSTGATPDTGARISFAIEVCASCHQESPFHTKPGQLFGAPHASLQVAQAEATVESRGTTAAHCGRCHSAQGFAQYARQLKLGYAGNLTSDGQVASAGNAATVASLTKLGLTMATVEPVTCAACHDPHDATNPHQVRLHDTIAALPNGLTNVSGVGSGALCMACHNTRNGEHNDFVAPPAAYTAPHVAAQTDVIFGFNAYFVPRSNPSSHLAVTDVCAGCHERIPTDDEAAAGQTSNHAFVTDTSICASCHAPSVSGAALRATFATQIAELSSAIGGKVLNLVNGALLPANGGQYTVRAWDPVSDLYSSTAASNVVLTAAPTTIDIFEIHGQAGFILHLPTAVTVPLVTTAGTAAGSITTQDVYVQAGALRNAAASAALFAANSDYTRALWNLFLLKDDGSLGIHNPRFYSAVLNATNNKVAALP